MKIIVLSAGKRKKTYVVKVFDGTNTVHDETVKSIQDRDELVWKLADLYNVDDIEILDVEKEVDTFKYSEIPSIPVLEEEEADEFFESNSEFVYDRILQAVAEGVVQNMESIRLFELNGTGVYITSKKADWKNGVQQALEYFISIEDYSKCIVARQLMLKL